MAKITINTVSDLKNFQTKIKVLRAVLPLIQKNAVQKFSNDVVLKEIHSKMKLNNFSPKIIDATFVGKTEFSGPVVKTHFISNYVAPENNFDVSEGREEGTMDHTVRPKKKGGVLRWVGKAGNVIFAKKSRPKGIERLLIIEKTIKENENNATVKISNDVAEQASRVLGV